MYCYHFHDRQWLKTEIFILYLYTYFKASNEGKPAKMSS